jgi:hypothetical protein
MTHISRRLRGDSLSIRQEVISAAIQPHQIAAAAHPEMHTKTLADRRMRARQALERKINDQLSKQATKER